MDSGDQIALAGVALSLLATAWTMYTSVRARNEEVKQRQTLFLVDLRREFYDLWSDRLRVATGKIEPSCAVSSLRWSQEDAERIVAVLLANPALQDVVSDGLNWLDWVGSLIIAGEVKKTDLLVSTFGRTMLRVARVSVAMASIVEPDEKEFKRYFGGLLRATNAAGVEQSWMQRCSTAVSAIKGGAGNGGSPVVAP